MTDIAGDRLNERLEVVESCRICGCRAFTRALSAGKWRLMRCESCGVVFTSPRYTAEELAQLYASCYYENATEYLASQSAPPDYDHISLARQVARHVQAPDPCSIDIGTGCGRQVAAFNLVGFRAKGTEPSKVACEFAQRHGRDVVNVDIADLPSESFDCVTALHVLEHVPEPVEFVRHLTRVAIPGGIVVIEVPNFASVASRRLGAAWHALYPDTHLFHFTPITLGDVCRRAGLAVIATHRIGGAGFVGAPATGQSSPPLNQAHSANILESSATKRRSITHAIWAMRGIVLSIPMMRAFLRWLNWEFLGYGEYVRVIARKPA